MEWNAIPRACRALLLELDNADEPYWMCETDLDKKVLDPDAIAACLVEGWVEVEPYRPEGKWFRLTLKGFRLMVWSRLRVAEEGGTLQPPAPSPTPPDTARTARGDAPQSGPPLEISGAAATCIGHKHPVAQSTPGAAAGQPAAELPWKQRRTGGMPLRGWSAIFECIGGKNNRARKESLKRLNASTDGPVSWCGDTPEVDPGELKAWIEDTKARDEAIQRRRGDESVAKEDLGERDGAHAQDYGAHIDRRHRGR